MMLLRFTLDLFLEISTHKINRYLSKSVINIEDLKQKINLKLKMFYDEKTREHLLQLVKVHIPHLKCFAKNLFQQITSYLNFISKDSEFTLQLCSRFAERDYQHYKVCATKFWSKNTVLSRLNGFIETINISEFEYLKENNIHYSVVIGYNGKISYG